MINHIQLEIKKKKYKKENKQKNYKKKCRN